MSRASTYSVLLTLLAACGSPVEPTLSSIQEHIFTPSCTFSGCHGNAGASRDLRLTAGRSFANLVNMESPEETMVRVVPGSPVDSLLIRVLEGETTVTPRMPLGGRALPRGEVDAIRQWIAEGALEN